MKLQSLSISGYNCIGTRDSAQGTSHFKAFNPNLNQEIDFDFIQATLSEAKDAAELAFQAYPQFSSISIQKRVAFLFAIADAIENHAPQLIHYYCLETALPEIRASIELKRSCAQFRAYASALESGIALNIIIETATNSSADLRKISIPIGPVVVFGASNFPFAYSTLGGDVASALAAGCPVIVKGHPFHPHTSEYSARIILDTAQKLGLPEGVFSHLHSKDYEIGSFLVQHPLVQSVAFTGSIKGGLALIHLAQKRTIPIPVFAEMGSSNPIIISESAVMNDKIPKLISDSIAAGAGQFCTSPGLIFLLQSENSKLFTQKLASELMAESEQTMLHPTLFENYRKCVEQQFENATLLVDGKREKSTISPSLCYVSGKQFLQDIFRQKEVFGSFATVIGCETESEILGCIQSLHGQLTVSIFHEPNDSISELIQIAQQKAGRIILNGVPTGVAINRAMHHGGPFPSSSDSRFSAVGSDAISRFVRPVTFQNACDEILPEPLKTANPGQYLRFVNGMLTQDAC